MRNFNIVCVIGTRPEALKMLPVIEELKRNKSYLVKTIITGQHRELLTQILKDSSIEIDVNFDVMQDNQNLNNLSASLFNHFERFLQENSCDLIIAQGDTTTTLVAALSAFYKKIAFAHVEAGLRTSSIHNPFPEEFNRRTTTQVSTLHFCPTKKAADNLSKEGIKHNVYVTGNTIIDTLYKYSEKISLKENSEKKLILVTCHRRENFGKPLLNICDALTKIAKRNPHIEILFPVHPNPNIKFIVERKLTNISNILLSLPLDYMQLVVAMKNAYLVLTDSGGLQEEAPALNKPVLVLRNETERPEGVECGASILVGHQPENIIQQVEQLLENKNIYAQMCQAGSPYGDGLASKRIAKIISRFLIDKATLGFSNTAWPHFAI